RFEILDALALGEVAGYLGEADEPPFRVVEGGDDDVRPERRAILADPQPLVLEAADMLRNFQLVLRPAPRHRLGGIELGEVQAEDLAGPVALDPLGAGVPADHVAFGVEHEDGIVADTLDEQPEALLALA